MKKLFLLVITLLVFVIPAWAQGDKPELPEGGIVYGDSVTGEITDREFEIEYPFIGEAGDVVVIEMGQVDSSGELDYPEVILLDINYDVFVSQRNLWHTRLVAEIPETGIYTVLATRKDGRSGESVGQYYLNLFKAEVLKPGSKVQGTANSDGSVYYALASDEVFTISYTKISGNFDPEVAVALVNEGAIEKKASLSGMLQGGMLIIDPSDFESNLLMLILEEASFDYNYEPVDVEYQIEVQ